MLRTRLAGVVALVLAVTLAPAPRAEAADLVVPVEHLSTDGPPMGLMLSMASWRNRPALELAGWLAYLCAQHRPGSGRGAIDDLVVMDVVNPTTGALDAAQLTVLLPYFPGGSGPCQFRRAYVGTVDLAVELASTPGVLHPYKDEVLRPELVASMLTRSAAAARAFAVFAVSRQPRLTWDWYVTQEALLDYFTNSNATTAGALSGFRTAITNGPEIASATLDYLTRYAAAVDAVRPGRRLLWSPGFAQPGGALFGAGGASRTAWRATMRTFFGALAARIGPRLVLDLQDHVGSSGWSPGTRCRQLTTPADALAWYRELQDVFTGAELQMNVEQFRRSAPDLCQTGGIEPGYAAALTARARYYVAHGVTLGPSFDLTSWSSVNRSNWALYRTTTFTGTRSTGRAVQAVLRTSDGRPLGNVAVSLLECDPTGGLCTQPPGRPGARTSSAGAVALTLPARASHWRLAVSGSTTGRTASGSRGWLASESPLVATAPLPAVRTSWTATKAIRKHGRVRLVGRLVTAQGRGVAGVRVTVRACRSAARCGSRVAAGVTGPAGRVVLRTRVGKRWFRLEHAGSAAYRPATSKVVRAR